jgi:hypothetical protein
MKDKDPQFNIPLDMSVVSSFRISLILTGVN